MSTDNAISYEIEASLKRHIDNHWCGDTYTPAGIQILSAKCPPELRTLLSYTDKNGLARIFGPSQVALGRVQEDMINLPNNLSVPSAYIEIFSNDPDSIESWKNSIYPSMDSSQSLDDQALIMIGGASRYHRRFVVKMTTFFIESDQTNAEVSRLGHAASSFLESMLKSYTEMPKRWAWHMDDQYGNTISDPFGEHPWRSHPVISHSRRRGGPPDDFIWDIKIYLEVATFQE